MANFYSDSHGERWGVMMQERKVSCGLACAAMAEVYMKSQVQANMEAIFREFAGSQLPAYAATDNTGIYGGAVIARGTLTGPLIITKPGS
jgi:hypothetical protein